MHSNERKQDPACGEAFLTFLAFNFTAENWFSSVSEENKVINTDHVHWLSTNMLHFFCDRKAGNCSWMIICSRPGQLLDILWLARGISEIKIWSFKGFKEWIQSCLLVHFHILKSGHSLTKRMRICEISVLKDLGVLGVWELSLLSVVAGLSLFWSRLGPPCSSHFPGCLAEGSRPDMNSMLCFRLSSLSYWKDNWTVFW